MKRSKFGIAGVVVGLGLGLSLGLGLGGCESPDLTSGLGIPAGETFNLGGGQDRAYRARILNRGETSVTVFAPESSGSGMPATEIRPGETRELTVASLTPLRLRNDSASRDAALKVEVYGDTNLSMYYLDTKADEGPAGSDGP